MQIFESTLPQERIQYRWENNLSHQWNNFETDDIAGYKVSIFYPTRT